MPIQVSGAFIALVLAAGIAPAYAAHPLVTDDTSTQGQGNNQLEANTDWLKDRDVKSRVATATYTYGANPTLDVYLNLPVSLSYPTGTNDISVGVKWRLWEDQTSSFGVKPELILPSGDVDKGLGYGRAGMGFTVLATHEAAPWTFHANAGLQLNRYRDVTLEAANRRTVWRASAAAVYDVDRNTALLLDMGVAKNTGRASHSNPAIALVGIIYSPRSDLDVDFGVKFGLNSAEVSKRIGCGLTVRF